MPSFHMLNATDETFTVTINDGQPFVLSGTDAGKRWAPTASDPIELVLYPSQGKFFYGRNQLSFSSAQSEPWSLSLYLDSAQYPLDDYQVFIFHRGGLGWALTKSGRSLMWGPL